MRIASQPVMSALAASAHCGWTMVAALMKSPERFGGTA